MRGICVRCKIKCIVRNRGYIYVKLIAMLNSIRRRVTTTITFDTLKFVEKLKANGVPEAQAKAEAEALVTAFSEAMDSQLATKPDINRPEREVLVIK
jgi:hypothetical protein